MKYLSYIILQVCVACVFQSCKEETQTVIEPLPLGMLKDGDLAFRRGVGLMSRAVLVADGKGIYSHVGILKQIDGSWFVIHAVPDEPDFAGDVDRVKVDSIARFFEIGRAVQGTVMRMSCSESAARMAAQMAYSMARRHVLFDHQYDLSDTTSMYCTELVEFVYRKVGVDLAEGRLSTVNMPGMRGCYLLPSDLMANRKLNTIYYFSR